MATKKEESDVATTKPKGIHAKILEIRKRVPVLSKNGVGPSTQGGYKFLSIDDILAAVVPLENELGVISYLTSSEVVFHYNRATDKGDGRVPKESTQGFGNFVFRFVDVDNPESFIDVDVPAEGADTSDKATRKTVTQAQKIAKITTYDLITGEADPDAEDGAAENQAHATSGGSPAATKSATQQRIDKARKPQAKADPVQGNVDWRQKVIDDYLAPGHVSRDSLNEMLEEFKGADDPFKAIHDSLAAQGK